MSRNITTAIVAVCLLVVVCTIHIACCKNRQEEQIDLSAPAAPNSDVVVVAEPAAERRSLWTESEEEELLNSIKEKLIPHQFDFINGTDTLSPHQFLHLHHMKTGGTSMDHLMKCGMDRMKRIKHWTVPYYNIHECAQARFKNCVQNEQDSCRGKMDESAILSFCAPLKHLDTFGWKESTIKAMTVLRNPVDRVWSMFRFQTKECYHCMNLTDIYDRIDNGKATDKWPEDSLCLKQLQNHEVINMLRKDFPEDATEEEMVEEAINNMKTFFTVIGLTERLQDTYELVGQVFPWLALQIEGSSSVCRLPHDNKSPQNNGCKPNPDGGRPVHWELPSHPDEETQEAIEAHNQMDMKLYEAAQQYFELQMRAAAMGEEG